MNIREKRDLQFVSGLAAGSVPLGRDIGVESDTVTDALEEIHGWAVARIYSEETERKQSLADIEAELHARFERLSNIYREPLIKFHKIPELNPSDDGVYNGTDTSDVRTHGRQEIPFYWDVTAKAWLSFDTVYAGMGRNSTAMAAGTPLRFEDAVSPDANGEGVCVPTDMTVMSVFGNCVDHASQPSGAHMRVYDDNGALFTFVWPDLTQNFLYSGIYYNVDRGVSLRITYEDPDTLTAPPREPKVYLGLKYRVSSGGEPEAF